MTPIEIEMIRKTVSWEGGAKLSLDPRDPGNWTGGKRNAGALKGTKFGISAKAYPHLNIAALTEDQADSIYDRDYFQRIGAGDFNHGVAMIAFDIAVNMGIGRILPWLAHSEHLTPIERIKFLDIRRRGYWRALPIFMVYGRGWFRREDDIYAFSLSLTSVR